MRPNIQASAAAHRPTHTHKNSFQHTHCNENPTYVFLFLGIGRPQSQFPHACVYERFIYSQDRSTYLAAAKQTNRSQKYINLSQIYERRDWEREHYNSVLEIKRLHSFISGNTLKGTRHLFWILTGPSFAVHPRFHLTPTSCEIMNFYVLCKFQSIFSPF